MCTFPPCGTVPNGIGNMEGKREGHFEPQPSVRGPRLRGYRSDIKKH